MDKKIPKKAEPKGKAWLSLLALILVAGLVGDAWISENPPSEPSSRSSFSARQAISQLRTILGNPSPHPTGSGKNAEVLDRIEKVVRDLGYRSSRQSAFLCSATNHCEQLQNLIVRIPGQVTGPVVLVDAHYDSVAAGPGVADNGSGVAIALEIARQIHARPQLKYPVVLLFDDAEEQGLLGSKAFVNSEESRDVAWAVNLDARGVRGPSLMYQTSNNNAALVRLYQRATLNPVANSLMAAVYEHLPSDTDFTNLSAHGIQGFNLAFLGGTVFYHRTGDNFDNLDPRSVQHQGQEALALVRALASDPPSLTARGNVVYFDMFRHEIVWPSWLCLVWIGSGIALLVFAATFHNPKLQPVALLRGAAALLLTSFLSAACGSALLWALYSNVFSIPQLPAHPAPAMLAFTALGLAIAALVFSRVPVKAQLREYLVGYWSTLILAGVGLYFALFGASYIIVAPVLVAALSLAAAVLWGFNKPQARLLAISGSIVGAGILWIPLLRLLYLGEGVLALPILCCVVSAIGLLWFAHPFLTGAALPRTAIGATLICMAAAIIAALLPFNSAAAPFAYNFYCIQGDGDQPRWVLPMPKKYLPQVADLMRAGDFLPEAHPERFFPFSSTAPVYSAPAATLPLPAVELHLLATRPSSTEICFDTRLTATQGVNRIVLWFPSTSLVKTVTFHGQTLSDASKTRFKRFSSSVPDSGLDASFCLDPKGSQDLYIEALEYGLPPAAATLVIARGDSASQSQDGDETFRFQHLRMRPSSPFP